VLKLDRGKPCLRAVGRWGWGWRVLIMWGHGWMVTLMTQSGLDGGGIIRGCGKRQTYANLNAHSLGTCNRALFK